MKILLAQATLVAALFAQPAAALAAPTAIAVTGSAVVTVVPDIATINASISTTDRRADAATSRNNQLYERAASALVAQGIARSDITLSYYNVSYQPRPQPQAGQPPDGAGTYGYTVTRSFAVKVRKISQAGAAVDALAPISGIEVGGVNFDIADAAPARAQATDRAMADARQKAEALAKAAGLHISGIRRIDLGGGGNVMPAPMIHASTMAAKAPTNFDAGNVNVSVDVNVVFLAGP